MYINDTLNVSLLWLFHKGMSLKYKIIIIDKNIDSFCYVENILLKIQGHSYLKMQDDLTTEYGLNHPVYTEYITPGWDW